ncbi:MAG: hypothetical protein ACXWMX_03205 [Candidatus Limnocylindrales bacterium]
MRRRKVTYPVAKTATKSSRSQTGDPRDPRTVRSTVATIDLTARDTRDDVAVGDRVRIGGGGLYAGAFAVIEGLSAGVIPAAAVRTQEGRTRRVRVVDLEQVAQDR